MSTTTLTRPEFTVVRRLRDLGAEARRAVAPGDRFREDLRVRLVAEAERNDMDLRRVSGSGCADC